MAQFVQQHFQKLFSLFGVLLFLGKGHISPKNKCRLECGNSLGKQVKFSGKKRDVSYLFPGLYSCLVGLTTPSNNTAKSPRN